MACPCFYPVEQVPQAAGKIWPLGDLWSGSCRRQDDSAAVPAEMRQLCNFGYAREKCTHVPGDSADAVRFSVSYDRDGIVSIYWVMEKDHAPFAHGPLEYSRVESGFRCAHPDATISRQAEAYVSSYLKRKEAL